MTSLAGPVTLDEVGRPSDPVVWVDLDETLLTSAPSRTEPSPIYVGLCRSGSVPEAAHWLDLTLRQRVEAPVAGAAHAPHVVDVPDLGVAQQDLAASVSTSPAAAVMLAQLLRVTAELNVSDALVVESAVYSTLLASSEFRRWRRLTPRRKTSRPGSPVAVHRDGGHLDIVLDDPERRNAFGRAMRDGLVEALELVRLDPSLTEVHLRGNGPSFCSGGDLHEFGTVDDPSSGHLVRLTRGAGAAMHEVSRRVEAHLHGWCIGAGIEIPAFAAHVTASPDTRFRLPELAMGLIPGAGGTVSIPRRIGRWRTAWLALSGKSIDAGTALRWGLIDAVG